MDHPITQKPLAQPATLTTFKRALTASFFSVCFILETQAAVFSVINSSDDGTGTTPGSLSWAISQSNTHPGSDTIKIETNVTLTTFAQGTNGLTGTPPITGSIAMIGNAHTIERSGALSCNVDQDFEIGEFRLFHVANVGELRVSNMILKNGCADITNTGSQGGAILNEGQLHVNSVTFVDNQAVFGGAIGTTSSSVIEAIQNSTFNNNSAIAPFSQGGFGAAISNEGVLQAITNNTFTQNNAENSGTIDSYAVDILSVTNNLFVDNVAGIGFTDCYVTANNGVFGSNNLSNTNSDGCGIVDNTSFDSAHIHPLANNPCAVPNDEGQCVPTHAVSFHSQTINGGGPNATVVDQRGLLTRETRDIGSYEFGAFITDLVFKGAF